MLPYAVMLDLPQVDSLIFLVMARYMGKIKKLKRAEIPKMNQICRINRAPMARASFEVPKNGNRAKDFAKV